MKASINIGSNRVGLRQALAVRPTDDQLLAQMEGKARSSPLSFQDQKNLRRMADQRLRSIHQLLSPKSDWKSTFLAWERVRKLQIDTLSNVDVAKIGRKLVRYQESIKRPCLYPGTIFCSPSQMDGFGSLPYRPYAPPPLSEQEHRAIDADQRRRELTEICRAFVSADHWDELTSLLRAGVPSVCSTREFISRALVLEAQAVRSHQLRVRVTPLIEAVESALLREGLDPNFYLQACERQKDLMQYLGSSGLAKTLDIQLPAALRERAVWAMQDHSPRFESQASLSQFRADDQLLKRLFESKPAWDVSTLTNLQQLISRADLMQRQGLAGAAKPYLTLSSPRRIAHLITLLTSNSGAFFPASSLKLSIMLLKIIELQLTQIGEPSTEEKRSLERVHTLLCGLDDDLGKVQLPETLKALESLASSLRASAF